METSTWWEFLWFQYHSCLKRQHWVNCWWMWTVILTILYLSLLYGTDVYIQVGTSWLMASLPEPNLAAIANKSNLSFSHTSESIPNWVLRIPCVTLNRKQAHMQHNTISISVEISCPSCMPGDDRHTMEVRCDWYVLCVPWCLFPDEQVAQWFTRTVQF